jgi:hypothetical protein
MEVLETFHMRFDERLKELEEVRPAQTRPASRPGSALALLPALSLLATGLVLGVGAAMRLVNTGVGAIP